MEPRRQQLLKTAKLQGWASVPNEILESPRPPRGEEEKQQKQLNSLFWSRTYLEQSRFLTVAVQFREPPRYINNEFLLLVSRVGFLPNTI